MKKHYQTMKTLVVLLVLLSFRSTAQLSGVVTIDNGSPSSATNFTSFTAFAAVLNGPGVNGPLTVNVAPTSTLYNEQVTFNQAVGISATNTITINGNGRTVSFNSSSSTAPHTILLSGADYMTFNNLNVIGLGTTYAHAVHLWNVSDNNQFNGCTFTTPLNGTSSSQVPFSISGSQTSATSSGNSGNNNVVNTCTMSGGYYNTVFYGNSVAPFNVNNRVINSKAVDFYFYGFYCVYNNFLTIKGNVVERLNRTTVSTGYGIYCSTGCSDALIEGNHVRKLFEQAPTSGNTAYCIYLTVSATLGHENYIRNNVISDIKSGSGTIYGIYCPNYAYNMFDHNTVALEEPSATGGTTYGIYSYSNFTKFRNNIVYINRGGTGTKACIASLTGYPNQFFDYNVLTQASTGGVNLVATMGTNYPTLAAWQAATNYDLHSTTVTPVFNNPAAMDYVPTSTAINNMCIPIGTTADFNGTSRSLLFPDPGAFEVFNTNCSGVPGANSFTVPTTVFCPGATLDLNLLNSNSYLFGNYAIAWQTSTNSAVGPFTTIPQATLNAYTVPTVTMDVYYRAIITCLSGGAYTTTSQFVDMATTTTSNVPYYESFENLAQNKLPNCSWTGSNMGGTTLTYTSPAANYRVPRTGSKFGAFANSAGGGVFYTNGIFLTAGINYSASVWYITEVATYTNNWNLSLLVGQNQSPTGLTQIVSTNGTVTPNLYTALGDTFSVHSTGLYYIAVRGVGGSNISPFLSWDDLSITIPCSVNSPNMFMTATSTTLCSGQTAALTGFGANTYSWSSGQTTNVITIAPTVPTTYTLLGYNTLSGCASTLTQFIDVQQSPSVFAYMNGPGGCAGKPINLVASGAANYFWNTGVNGSNITVTPSGSTNYSVVGTNALGCSNMAVVQVTVNPAPNVSASSSNNSACVGDNITLTGNGAATYQWWLSNSMVQSGNPLNITPNATATYTLIGTDNKGCEGKTVLTVAVSECTGLTKTTGVGSVKVYPNPASGVFAIELPAPAQSLVITDVTGRVVLAQSNVESNTNFDISTLANGIYYVKVSTGTSTEVIKVVKSSN